MNGWFEIFKAGTWIDSAGNERTYTRKDLDKIVASYDPSEHEAPLVIGHPKSDGPAYGWVAALKRSGDTILAKAAQVVPEFADLVARGLYKKRSVALYPNLSLRHVGFLGAVPPAVKGLENIAFADNDGAVTLEFGEAEMGAVARLFNNLRDFFIDKYDIETADRLLPKWDLDFIVPPSADAFSDLRPAQISEDEDMSHAEKARLAELEAENKRLKTEADAARAEREQAAQQLSERQVAERRSEFEQFCAPLVDAGKLLPAQRDLAVELYMAMPAEGELEFADGKKQGAAAAFRELFSSLPKQLETGEIATGGGDEGSGVQVQQYSDPVDEGRMEIHKKALALAGKEKIEYREAVRRVMVAQ